MYAAGTPMIIDIIVLKKEITNEFKNAEEKFFSIKTILKFSRVGLKKITGVLDKISLLPLNAVPEIHNIGIDTNIITSVMIMLFNILFRFFIVKFCQF